jgi:glycerophosphoryl diester phosphodiesterase
MAAIRQHGTTLARVSAHMGGSERARPATYEAYEQAPATGAEYVEFDIRRTRDGVLVAHHDARAGNRAVSELSYAGLCERAGYRVPLVKDAMRLAASRSAGHLDLKETGYEGEVIALAEAVFGSGNFIATTLEDVSVAAIKRSFPEVRTALSLGRDLRGMLPPRRAGVRYSELFPLPRIRACGADWVAVHHRLARLSVLRACGQHGIGVMVWTVDSDRLMDSLIADERVDVLITNRPGRAVRRRAVLGPAGGRAPADQPGELAGELAAPVRSPG